MHVPRAGSSRVVLVRQGWAVLVAKVSLGSSLQPFFLPTHGVAASLLAHCCLFPDAYRCFLFKGMDRWLQAVE